LKEIPATLGLLVSPRRTWWISSRNNQQGGKSMKSYLTTIGCPAIILAAMAAGTENVQARESFSNSCKPEVQDTSVAIIKQATETKALFRSWTLSIGKIIIPRN
jgi:hypothetical protein